MAGATPDDAASQVKALQEAYGSLCRVIQDVGDFVYIVTVKFDDMDLALTFQIEGKYKYNTMSQKKMGHLSICI